MSIIAISGSYKFKKEMIDVYQRLTDAGHIVLLPAIGCSKHEQSWYLNLHFKKIEMADIVFVVNIGGYIGEATSKEIEKAFELGKIVTYLEPNSQILKECVE